MGVVIHTIGIGGTHDFTTWAAWEAGIPANLVTDGNSQVGQGFFNGSGDGEFIGTGNLLGLSGHTTSTTFTITVTTGTGQSFRDNAGVQTNALTYNAANGVGFNTSSTTVQAIDVSDSNVVLSGLQVKAPSQVAVFTEGSPTNIVVNYCIIQGGSVAGTNYAFRGSGGTTIRNSVISNNSNIVVTVSGVIGGSVGSGTGGPQLYFCTVVAPSDVSTKPSVALEYHYGSNIVENCALFGCIAVSSGTFTYTTCMTDVASPPTGITGSETYANQFVNTAMATPDWREKTGANLQGTGTADSVNGANDIAGTTRPQGVGSGWDIGAWELISAPAATFKTKKTKTLLFTPMMIAPWYAWKSLSENNTLKRRTFLSLINWLNKDE